MRRVDELRAWLESVAGFSKAHQLIRDEARALRVPPTSDAAVRHAVATYQQETGKAPNAPTPAHLQEGLIP